MLKPLCLALTLIAGTSLAQTQPKQPASQKIEFTDGDDIIGNGLGPDVEVVAPKPSTQFGSLIKARESFKEKVLESFKEL